MIPYFTDDTTTLYLGDALEVLGALPAGSVDCCVTSPPYYGLRDYGVPGQIGLEASPAEYVETLRTLFAEVARVLTTDGVLWLNLGDSYAGKANGGESVGATRGRGRHVAIPKRINTTAAAPYKSLLGIPWRVAFALMDDGWAVRNDTIWHKPNAMPESVRDRLSCRHEHLFLLARSSRYHFDLDAIRQPHRREWTAGANGGHRLAGGSAYDGLAVAAPHPAGSNPGDVWTIPTRAFPGAHFAAMPPAIAERCVLAGCKPGGVVLDPFSGSGTTGLAAARNGRRYIGVDLNRDYLDLSLRTRLAQPGMIGADA